MALSHRFIWGVNAAGVKGCVHFHDDSTVVYSVGHTVVLYNSSERQQRFIAGSSEALGFSAIALCPSKRFIAVAEKADRASIVVYDLRTLRKRKNLSQPDASCSRYANICFSQDNETLVAITGDGATPSLVTWRWAKGKVSATVALQEGPPGSVYFECLYSPLDNIISTSSARISPSGIRRSRSRNRVPRLRCQSPYPWPNPSPRWIRRGSRTSRLRTIRSPSAISSRCRG